MMMILNLLILNLILITLLIFIINNNIININNCILLSFLFFGLIISLTFNIDVGSNSVDKNKQIIFGSGPLKKEIKTFDFLKNDFIKDILQIYDINKNISEKEKEINIIVDYQNIYINDFIKTLLKFIPESYLDQQEEQEKNQRGIRGDQIQ